MKRMKNLLVVFLIMAGLLTLVISCETDESVDSTVQVNYALKATTTASSTFIGYSPSFVKDDDLSTDVGDGWANDAGTSLPQWVQLTFSESKKISRVVIYTSADYEIQDYQIQYLDGSDWKTAATVTGNTKTVITFLPLTKLKAARYEYTQQKVLPVSQLMPG